MDDINVEQIKQIKNAQGHQIKQHVERYILDTQALLAEIVILRATGNENNIYPLIKILKLSSHDLAANKIESHAQLIEDFLEQNEKDMALIHIQMRLDGLIQQLNNYFSDYRNAIHHYL